jgi:hypothetical protein
MLIEKAHDYHVRRARAELDAAYRATTATVAEAHLRLSVLHMRKLRECDAAAQPAGPKLRARPEARISA